MLMSDSQQRTHCLRLAGLQHRESQARVLQIPGPWLREMHVLPCAATRNRLVGPGTLHGCNLETS